MLQRIQSFYLVLALVGIIMLFKFPIASYTLHDQSNNIPSELKLTKTESTFNEDSISYIGNKDHDLKGKWVLSVIVVIIGVLSLASIFMFKNRILQMRVVACAGLLNAIYLFLIFLWAINGISGDGGYLKVLKECGIPNNSIDVNMWTPGTIIPIVTLILLYLAQRAIKKDELKVRAADRLR